MLTVKQVERLSKRGRYLDAHGLSLQVSPSGVKSWLFRYKYNGRERVMGLGPCHTVDLHEARERAHKARHLLLDGVDPRCVREAEQAGRALEEAQRRYKALQELAAFKVDLKESV
jgi:Arm DNA-binding domain